MTGSSPLTRGKRRQRQVVFYRRGLIPAHAGKTPPPVGRSLPRRAHPRSRGENHRMKSVAASLMGSSPLTRGKHRLPGRCHRRHGLIPAHAGKTHPPRCPARYQRAHPRSRGENHRRHIRLRAGQGSSPLTRGKRASPRLSTSRLGLIPAHAGKTFRLSSRSSSTRAHPRSRGENTS